LCSAERARRRQATQKKVLRELTNNGTTIKLLAGRYGPYVTDGTTNASIPRGTDPVTISLEDSRALIEARAGAPPRPSRGTRKSASRARGTRTRKVAAAAADTAPAAAKRKAPRRKRAAP